MATTGGRVPVRLRIGVTGHRVLADEATVAARVEDVVTRLQRMLPPADPTPVLLEVVSPLGEGADRVVAERILQVPGAILEVPLPLPRDEYERDFATEGSRERFRALLERADRVWVVAEDEGAVGEDGAVGEHQRVDAYRETGDYVVDSCDVLIAIWDGLPPRGPGGTGDVVDRAREQAMPTFRIGANTPFAVEDPTAPIAPLLIREVRRFNDGASPAASERPPPPTEPENAAAEETSGDEAARLRTCLAWSEPYLRRSALIAERARRWFTWGSRALFMLSASAILAVALSVVVDDEGVARGFAILEVALIGAALALWLLVRRRLHARWIEARFLAERLRSAGFLAFAGERADIASTPRGERDSGEGREASQEWINRVYREIWRDRPRLVDAGRAVEDVRRLLIDRWVDRQLAYYDDRAKDHARASSILTIAGAALFGGTLVAAALHAAELVHGGLSDLAVVLSIALPAFAGALAGIAALELHARHATRFRLMSGRLRDLRDRVAWAPKLDGIRATARMIEAELRTEEDAWIDVMRFQDVDLPS
jgi:hypothetical protein